MACTGSRCMRPCSGWVKPARAGAEDYSGAMVGWSDFAESAPRIVESFLRRHAASGNLCLLATLRSDGSPRISPMEPKLFEGRLWLMGMPGTLKFRDLARDPRFCLHTATVDTQVTDGDAKLWGVARDVRDTALHQRFAEALFDETGFDLRGSEFDHFYDAELTGGSAVQVADGHLDITIWKPGHAERVIRKH